jgi:hypothetical protein
MANKKKKPGDEQDMEQYRKPFKQVRVKLALAEAAEDAAEALVQDLTHWVNDAVRMRLEAEGRWPAKK